MRIIHAHQDSRPHERVLNWHEPVLLARLLLLEWEWILRSRYGANKNP
jgi:hypothetical protein